MRATAAVGFSVCADDCSTPVIADLLDDGSGRLRGLTQFPRFGILDGVELTESKWNLRKARAPRRRARSSVRSRSQVVDSKAACPERAKRVERRDGRVVEGVRLERDSGDAHRASLADRYDRPIDPTLERMLQFCQA